MEWIHVGEKLPYYGETVLVFANDDITFAAHYSDWVGKVYEITESVIWWMPLPFPPEEKKRSLV